MAEFQGTRVSETLRLLIDRLAMPIGVMIIMADRKENLRAVDWTDHEIRMQRILRLHYGAAGAPFSRRAIRMA